jgi:redox-sensitive bicupin YhaK (pirin superfamily)
LHQTFKANEMERKEFIKKAVLAGVVSTLSPHILTAKNSQPLISSYKKLIKQVGFNHLPNKNIKTMNTVIHKSETRGNANHGWLNSRHTFSFANYRNPERMNFGALRVLNDDRVQANMGFGTHPHDNMEIISIPLKGDLEHKDSMGNIAIIKEGDVQIMSAGTGITHSEYNKNKDIEVKFLQIWVFPKERNVAPRYDQISIKGIEKVNDFYQVVSPNKEEQGVWINQDAWFHLGKFTKGNTIEYEIKKPGNGVYAFILEGEVEINNEILSKRDGIGIWNTESISVKTSKDSHVLLMEVPMNI